MIKKLIITSTLSIFAFANTQIDSKFISSSLDDIISTISKNAKSNIVIKNKKVTDKSQTFDIVFESKKIDKISSHSKTYKKDLDGLTISNSINYTKASLNGSSTLTSFPKNAKGKKIIKDKVIKDKVATINYDYNLKDFKYNISLKDINDTFDKGHLYTKNIKVSGVYDKNNLFSQESNLSLEKVKIIPLSPKLKGQYVNIENVYISSDYASRDDKKIDLNFDILINLLDYKVEKQSGLVKNFRFKVTLGNLDKDNYLKLSKIYEDNPTIAVTTPKVMELLTKLLVSKDLFIAIEDLSVESVKVLNQDFGTGKISIKLSLENNPQLLQMIKMSPLMAIGSLNVDAKINISQAMYDMLLNSPKGKMLKMLPINKDKNGQVVYDISLKKGKLLINGEEFPPKRKKH